MSKIICPNCGEKIGFFNTRDGKRGEILRLLSLRDERTQNIIKEIIRRTNSNFEDILSFLQRVEGVDDENLYKLIDSEFSILNKKGGLKYIGTVIRKKYQFNRDREETVRNNTEW